MGRLVRWAALLFALILLAVGLYHGLHREEELPMDSSSAALGLMLLERERGLYVLAVAQGSPAERSGVQPGDYLVAPGNTVPAGLEWLEKLLSAGEEAVPLTLHRDGRDIPILLPVR